MTRSLAIGGIVETALHVKDVARSTEFYEQLFAIRHLIREERFGVLPIPGSQVLLLFLEGGTGDPVPTPGGVIPPHGGSGELHVAFKIATGDLDAWRKRLAELGIAIESTVKWQLGGTSLYFRDPDHHLIELITPGCWSVY
jgi:catechol 2,3-dioxygenase-like lactoylglutathione lyase family enzyme